MEVRMCIHDEEGKEGGREGGREGRERGEIYLVKEI